MALPVYEPMLASPWPRPFSDHEWWFEVKWDGVRVLAYLEEGKVALRTRRGREVSDTYPDLGSLRVDRATVLDGEVVALDSDGMPSFALLQQRMNIGSRTAARKKSESVPITYMVFDLLHHGVPMVGRPIEERWEVLAALNLPPPVLRAEPVGQEGEALFAAVQQNGLEGMVGKRRGSLYRPGLRSSDWRKVASRHLMRAVVGGFTLGAGGRAGSFGSLMLGLWAPEGLRFVGAVGSGFDDASLVAIRSALVEMAREGSPFAGPIEVLGEARFVDPQLVAVVEYKEWTPYGRLRAPVFKGFAGGPPESPTWEAEGPRDPRR
ncbi:MAG TPA: non-homologous end-joining DNA ligase [Acidimicrobiia bacterium]|nr:non-homologous end-joining DNA ligase [Acidimicrobiia bacterium]